MSVTYYLVFGQGDPSGNTGLSPTFTVFQNAAGGATTAPVISEISATGIYTFNYAPLGSINFVASGVTTGLVPNDRFITGSLDISDESAINIGLVTDVIGDSVTDPTTLFGFMRRVKAWLEGQSTFTKSSGTWVCKEETGATTLSSRVITDNVTTIDKV